MIELILFGFAIVCIGLLGIFLFLDSNTPSKDKKSTVKPDSDKFNMDDIPLGICCRCSKKQINAGKDGFWIDGLKEEWACFDCKYGNNGSVIRSRAFACEWCTYNDVKWFPFNTYDCPRCDHFGIHHH